jgi:hypothetical protein
MKAIPAADRSLEQLQARVHSDARLAAAKLDGRWVAMLSSKNEGIVDPLQATASGGHLFGWSDILVEHERLRADSRFRSPAFLIMSTDFGSRVRVKGKPLFVTVVDNGFSSRAQVRSWCEETFAELAPAQRRDACAPVKLAPPT